MTSLQQKLEKIGSAHAAVVPQSYHYWRPQLQPPYCIWQEDGEVSALDVNDRKADQCIGGHTDYYTKTEYDPAVDAIQEMLNGFDFPFGWTLEGVDYEDDTGLIHFSWNWEAT